MLEKIFLHIGPHFGQKPHWLFDPLYYFVHCQTIEQNGLIICVNEPQTYLTMPILFVVPLAFFASYFVTKRMVNIIHELLNWDKSNTNTQDF